MEKGEKYIFGAHILESLTTGMYQDSRMIFREYIQNACDSVDAAVKSGILDYDENTINITLDSNARKITIEDNAAGIKSGEFVRVLGNVADSEKRQGESRGFRGIGRLCGLAYCRKLTFTAKFAGENVVSVLTCDAEIMRELIGEDREKKYTASEVLDLINEFTAHETEDTEAHYFRVELDGINKENTDLLDCCKVKEYLSFTAPLPYQNSFVPFREKIYEHAAGLGLKIDEYNIYLNDEQLFKTYTRDYNTRQGGDEIIGIKFEDFMDINNNLVAWLWYGQSHFRGAIEEKCRMRGIRLRKENIQVGNAETLGRFFSEQRGIHYFIGELFCVSRDLIPNSQRDYFNENPARVDLEKQIRNYFRELSRIYHEGSRLNSSYRKIDSAERAREEFTDRLKSGEFVSEEDRKNAREAVSRAEEEARKARAEITKLKASGSDIAQSIIKRKEYQGENITTRASNITPHTTRKYTQKEQQLIRKIYGIIKSSLDSNTAGLLIQRIEDCLQ